MPRRDILLYPDSRLSETCAPVEDFDDDLKRLADDLADTLAAHGALGLSAPQIGDMRRVLVIAPPSADRPTVYVNPHITAKSLWGFVEESCLSAPGVVGSVMRATRVTVTARDVDGARLDHALEDMAAVSLQHEIDHLDGRMFFDRFTVFGRMRARARARRETERLAARPLAGAAAP